MKKLLALILSFALLMTALIVPMSVQAAEDLIPTTQITDWDGRFIVAEKGQYLRPKVLKNGNVGAAWYVMGEGGKFGISTDGGVTYGNVVQVVSNGWDKTEEERLAGNYGYGRLEVQNPNFIEMKNGDLLYTYRYNTYTSEPDSTKENATDANKIKAWDTYYSSIRYQISTDGGKNWSDPVIIKESIQPDAKRELGRNGYWEPEPYYIGEDLYVYWCDTVTNYENLGVQNVLGAKWDGEKFGESFIAVDGTKTSSRDGMCVVTTLQDGTYAMVYESTDTDGVANTHNIHDNKCRNCEDDEITFVIKMARSTDGVDWNEENAVIIATPDVKTGLVDQEGGAENVCASPYIVTLPDGRLAISYQTTDLYKGDVIPNAVVRRSVVQVAISDVAVGYDTAISTANFKKIAESPADIGDNQFANAGSMLYNNGRLLAYLYTGTNILNEDGSVSSKSEGLKGAYINIEEKNLTDSFDNYHIYTKGAAPTETDGVISITAGDTTNLISGYSVEEEVAVETTIENIYDSTNYQVHGNGGTGFTFNSNSIVNSNNQTKGLLKNTSGTTTFNASVTLKGSSSGQIWSGIAFRVQENDFTNATFNTAGYSAYIIRKSASLDKATVMFRYCNPKNSTKEVTTAISNIPTAKDLQLRLDVTVDNNENAIIKVLSADGTVQYGNTITHALDATSKISGTTYYKSGSISLIAHGVNTLSNIKISKTGYETISTKEFNKATDLSAHAVFTMLEKPAAIYAGFDLRVKSAAAVTRGIEGYAIKLVQSATASNLKLELSRYGTNSDGKEYQNLGNDTVDIKEILIDGTNANAKIILDATIQGNKLIATATNYNDKSKTITKTFDLSTYNVYFDEGGYGIYKHGNGTIKVEDVKFTVLPANIANLDTSLFTVYAPEESEDVILGDRKIINNDATAKKIILNDTLVADFNADATFEVGDDGNFKGGIIFRAQNVGNDTDAMEGYSVVIWKNPHTTGNNGRIVLMLYKWGRDAEGNMKYLGEIGRLVDTTTFNAVHPDAQNSILDSAGKHIKLNVAVKGNAVTASFDVLSDENIVAASSEEAVFDLNAKTFAAETNNTLYNYGAIGVSLSTKGALCDFNVEKSDYYEFSDINGYEQRSNNANELVVDKINNKIYSVSAGYKQAVLTGKNFSDFEANVILKSTSAGEQYNMGFDFHITSTSDTASNTGGFEGYRAVVVRNQNSHSNPDGTVLYIFKFTKNEDGTYSRETVASKSHADFFADYTTEDTTDAEYGNVEVDLKVVVKDGKLTATATMCEYPDKVITVTADGFDGQGQIGWFVYQGGSFTGLSVKAPVENAAITSANCENGFVYAAKNSGAAKDGDTVVIVPKANEGYEVDTVSYTVNGKTTTVEAVDGVYSFAKPFGATEISATFKEAALIGDINGDGKVDGTDLVWLSKILLKVEKEYDATAADITGNGVVDVRDLVALKELAKNA